jgi:hypothetical protein
MSAVRKTSIEVYHKIKAEGLLSKMRFAVYEELFLRGPMTGKELDKALGTDSAHKRLSELKALGVVEDSEPRTRSCEVSGENVVEWDVTGRLPDYIPGGSETTKPVRPSPRELAKAVEEFREMYRLAAKVGFQPTEATTRLGKWLAAGAPSE